MINMLYYSWRDKIEGYEKGTIRSYYFNPPRAVGKYQKYFPIQQPFWAYGFPRIWYDIDKDVQIE